MSKIMMNSLSRIARLHNLNKLSSTNILVSTRHIYQKVPGHSVLIGKKDYGKNADKNFSLDRTHMKSTTDVKANKKVKIGAPSFKMSSTTLLKQSKCDIKSGQLLSRKTLANTSSPMGKYYSQRRFKMSASSSAASLTSRKFSSKPTTRKITELQYQQAFLADFRKNIEPQLREQSQWRRVVRPPIQKLYWQTPMSTHVKQNRGQVKTKTQSRGHSQWQYPPLPPRPQSNTSMHQFKPSMKTTATSTTERREKSNPANMTMPSADQPSFPLKSQTQAMYRSQAQAKYEADLHSTEPSHFDSSQAAFQGEDYRHANRTDTQTSEYKAYNYKKHIYDIDPPETGSSANSTDFRSNLMDFNTAVKKLISLGPPRNIHYIRRRPNEMDPLCGWKHPTKLEMFPLSGDEAINFPKVAQPLGKKTFHQIPTIDKPIKFQTYQKKNWQRIAKYVDMDNRSELARKHMHYMQQELLKKTTSNREDPQEQSTQEQQPQQQFTEQTQEEDEHQMDMAAAQQKTNSFTRQDQQKQQRYQRGIVGSTGVKQVNVPLDSSCALLSRSLRTSGRDADGFSNLASWPRHEVYQRQYLQDQMKYMSIQRPSFNNPVNISDQEYNPNTVHPDITNNKQTKVQQMLQNQMSKESKRTSETQESDYLLANRPVMASLQQLIQSSPQSQAFLYMPRKY